MAKKKEIKEGARLAAYAEFELLGRHYAEGDEFVAPEGFKRDIEFETFRNLDRPRGAAGGVVFLQEIPLLDQKGKPTGEVDAKRHILPLKEA